MSKPSIQGGSAAPAPEQAAALLVAATEEQARAILNTARRAVEEEEAGAGKLSVKRSLEWFLEGRKNKAVHHGDEADASSSASN